MMSMLALIALLGVTRTEFLSIISLNMNSSYDLRKTNTPQELSFVKQLCRRVERIYEEWQADLVLINFQKVHNDRDEKQKELFEERMNTLPKLLEKNFLYKRFICYTSSVLAQKNLACIICTNGQQIRFRLLSKSKIEKENSKEVFNIGWKGAISYYLEMQQLSFILINLDLKGEKLE